jgi:predicted nucleic acid-binding Zn ribbon protein
MPVYEYQCAECGVRFERIQSFHDDPVTMTRLRFARSARARFDA